MLGKICYFGLKRLLGILAALLAFGCSNLNAQVFQDFEQLRLLPPAAPEWLDNLPFKVNLNEQTRYNDNILLLPAGTAPPSNMSRGDYYSVATAGYNSKFYLGGQTLFSDGSYTFTRYARDYELDTTNYSIDGGVNWVFTARCSGQIIAASRRVQAPFEEQVTFGVNNVNTDSLNETGRCRVAADWTVLLDSGLTEIGNSLASSVANNNRAQRLRAGVEYAVDQLNTLRATTTFTDRDFFDRSSTATPGLATILDQRDYELYYQRIISPRLKIEGTIGQTEFIASSPAFSSKASNPTYSATVTWNPTPKLEFDFITSLGYSQPLTIVADFQRVQLYSVVGKFAFSPVLSFVAQASLTNTNYDAVLGGANGTVVLEGLSTLSASLEADYVISPLMNAMLRYQYTDRTFSGVRANSNLYLAGLTYRR